MKKTNKMGGKNPKIDGATSAGSQSAGSGTPVKGQADFGQGNLGPTTNAGGANFSNTKKG